MYFDWNNPNSFCHSICLFVSLKLIRLPFRKIRNWKRNNNNAIPKQSTNLSCMSPYKMYLLSFHTQTNKLTNTYIHTHTRTHKHTHIHLHVHKHTHIHSHTLTHTHSYTRTLTHTRLHTYPQTPNLSTNDNEASSFMQIKALPSKVLFVN